MSKSKALALWMVAAMPAAGAFEVKVLDTPTTVPRFGLFEVDIKVNLPVAPRPFVDVRVSGTFRAPDGSETAVRGFCDDARGRAFKVRFCPSRQGTYRFDVRYQGPGGAAQRAGQFSCTESDRVGFVRVDPQNPYHFLCDDGTRPFVFSKTAWCIAGVQRQACQDFLHVTARNGLNCIRFGIETDYFKGEPGIEDVWPWAGSRRKPQWDAFDVDRWRAIENVIRCAAEKGLFVEPVLFCSLRRRGQPHPIPDPQMQLYWTYAIHRLAPFANIICWELFNEYAHDKPYQQYMARFLRKHDPYGHLIATSFGTTTSAAWPEASWLDLAINHSCTSSDPSRHGLRSYYRTVARNIRRFNKPAWADETGRKRHGNLDGVHRRKQYWVWNLAGCYTNYHTWQGNNGIGALRHRDGPGEAFCQHITRFWKDTTWWLLEPADERIAGDPPADLAMCLASEREVVVYLAFERSGTRSPGGELKVHLPPGRFVCQCYNPANGMYRAARSKPAEGADGLASVALPAFTDDIVVRFKAR